jgi:hypothetical protein
MFLDSTKFNYPKKIKLTSLSVLCNKNIYTDKEKRKKAQTKTYFEKCL